MKRKETVEKLLFMANWLENMHITHPVLKFDYSVLVEGDLIINEGGHACGTIGCAVGNMPWMWPHEASLTADSWRILIRKSHEFLGIDESQWERLFQPGSWPDASGLANNATAKDVAAHIRRCAKAIGEGVDITDDEFRGELAELEGYKFRAEDEDEDEDY